MRILFLHRNFPGQFLHLARHFAQDPQNQVVFITERKDRSIQGVLKAVYKIAQRDMSKTHQYLRTYEEAILHGQASARVAIDLKKKGFIPDIIFGHTWGQNLFMKDLFPGTPLMGYFEWFYNTQGSDVDFDPVNPVTTDTQARVRIKNSPILVDLYSCDHGVCPTQWQLEQFPEEFRHKITVLHDGINTDYFKPDLNSKPVLPQIKLGLSGAKEIVTYVSRGLEPYRGFPQFMEATALILEKRPECHIVIVGEDKVFYGSKPPDGKTFKQLALEKTGLDTTRVHFTGYIPYDRYLKVLQASSAHVYLTYPFVLSWSMLEAMSAGCLVLASNTPPVTEVIRDGHNGILFDFFSPREIAGKVNDALDHQEDMLQIRHYARETILKKYDLKDLLPRQVKLIKGLAEGERAL
jgi:glycosyltransferase involved in cell wall biosynthesis